MPEKICHEEFKLRELALPLLGKWVPFILLLLDEKTRHFAELEREIGQISRKVLTENLINLQSSGLIHKTGLSSTGFPVSYRLTELGKSYIPILYQVKHWLRLHQDEINDNQQQFKKISD